MARVKPKRHGIHIDMTPMSDLAWLLLTFFILTTQFKPKEIITINPPSSVSTKKIAENNMMKVFLTRDGKCFFSMEDERYRKDLLEAMGQKYNISFSDEDKKKFAKIPEIGVPLNQLKSFINLTKDQQETFNANQAPGIPYDSLNAEVADWVNNGFKLSEDMKLAIKGDVGAKYPVFKQILDRLQDKNINKFQLITSTE